MIPSIAEVVAWVIVSLIIFGVIIWWSVRTGSTDEMSDYWMDRHIHGRK